MKKITLLMFAMVASFAFNATAQSDAPNAEVILTQSVGEVLTNGGVSCGGSDNWWMREYVLDQSLTLTGVQFSAFAIDFDEEFEVYAFAYTGFPAGFDITAPPAALASGFLTVTAGDAGVIVTANFDTPVVANAGTSIVVAVVQPFADGNNIFLGTTDEDTKESYLGSEACGLAEPDTVTNVGFPGAKHLVNLVGDDALSVGDVLAGNVSVYPNPTTDIFNVSLPSNVVVNSSSVVDILGKTTGVGYNNGQVNVTSLSTGVYFLKLDTNFGTYTQKVIKQ